MSTTNTGLSFKGNPIEVKGAPVTVGSAAPKFTVTGNDLSDLSLDSLVGRVVVISVIPSIDTPVCAQQTARFNQEASKLSDKVTVLTVSMDLPFAQKRWCAAEGAQAVVMASDYKHRSFGEAYGTLLPSLGLLTRAVFVLDKNHTVQYVEYVDEVTSEPTYEPVLKKISELIE